MIFCWTCGTGYDPIMCSRKDCSPERPQELKQLDLDAKELIRKALAKEA